MGAGSRGLSLEKFKEVIDLEMRILVVDDSQTMRRVIITNLKDLGFSNMVSKEDGALAWESFQHDDFDLVLCDHRMPNMTGVEFLEKVRSAEKNGDVPFIMITAESFRENVMEAVKLGVSNYIVKPFSNQQLMEKIAKTLLSIQAAKEKEE